MILGVDVSIVQGVVDWSKLFDAGVRFAWLKCSEGNKRGRDSRFALNVRDAKAAGVYVGAYHFCYPLPSGANVDAGRDPVSQARRAFAEADQLGRLPGELPPACDIEWPAVNEWTRWGVTAASIADWTLAYLEEAARLWDRTPVLYTYPAFWKALGEAGKADAFARFPLWIAHYKHLGPGLPPEADRPIVPAPWDDWTVWQFSGDKGARLPGCAVDIDRNVWRGDLDGLRRLAGIDPEAETRPDLPALEDDGGDARRDATTEAVVDAARREITARAK